MDAKLMTKLGANTIRVYHVCVDHFHWYGICSDDTQVDQGDHSSCMQTFSDAGIYIFLDLDTFNTQIEQADPHWNQTQEQAFETVMDEFHQYDNVAGFFIGNEVIEVRNGSSAAVYVKSATRDLKTYRDSKGYRSIPIGYSHADIESLRPNLQNYLACGTNTTENIDFFGLNAYEWCGNNDFQNSGYSTLESEVMNFDIPIFLSETGCNTVEPRTFQDQTAVFGPDMDQNWSGAIIYEWIQEANGYGLVAYDSAFDQGTSSIPGTASIPRSGTPTPVTPDFSNLMSVWSSVTPSSISANAYNPTLTPPPCPAYTPGVWEVNGDVSLPAVGQVANTASVTAGIVPLSSCPVGYTYVGNLSNIQLPTAILTASLLSPSHSYSMLTASDLGSAAAPSATGSKGAASGGKVCVTFGYADGCMLTKE